MNFKKIITIVALVLAVPLLFFGGYYARGYYDKKQLDSASTVAKQFVNDVVAGKTAQAYVLTTKDLQSKQTQKQFVTAMSGLQSSSVKLDKPQILKNGSQVLYIQQANGLPKTKDGSEAGSFYITVSKEGQSWKVTTASVY